MSEYTALVQDAQEAAAKIKSALDLAENIDGAHHKQWIIDQMVRALTGSGYQLWVTAYQDGEDGPETYAWDTGIAP